MTATQVGMAIAALLAVVWITVSFGAMILVAVAIVIGALIGRYVSGQLDLSGIVDAIRGRRSSS